MEILPLIGTVMGVAGGLTYAVYRRSKKLGEKELLRYVAFVASRRIASGKEILLDDLKNLYAEESKRLFGIAGTLTAEESHQITAFISELSGRQVTKDDGLKWRLNSLKRSLPLGWVVAAGQNYISNAGGFVILICMIALRSMMRGQFKGGLFARVAVVSVESLVALIFIVSFLFHVRMFLKSRSAINTFRRTYVEPGHP